MSSKSIIGYIIDSEDFYLLQDVRDSLLELSRRFIPLTINRSTVDSLVDTLDLIIDNAEPFYDNYWR